MTAHKHLKERIRARMARTGESYTTARRHILNALPASEYQLLGGLHPDAHAIAGVLANRGLLHPGTGQPLSEAMVLGVGGGLGAGYILWEFKQHASATMVLGLHNNWNYPVTYFSNICRRVGAQPAACAAPSGCWPGTSDSPWTWPACPRTAPKPTPCCAGPTPWASSRSRAGRR